MDTLPHKYGDTVFFLLTGMEEGRIYHEVCRGKIASVTFYSDQEYHYNVGGVRVESAWDIFSSEEEARMALRDKLVEQAEKEAKELGVRDLDKEGVSVTTTSL